MYVCLRALVCCFSYCISQQNPVSQYECRNCQDPEIRSGHDLWRGWKTRWSDCQLQSGGTIVIDRKFIQWAISQIPELMDSNYVVQDAFIVHLLTTVLNVFFFRMHATYRIHHKDRDFGTLIMSGIEKLWTFSFRKWRKGGFYEGFR